jgi:hypothetical protein
MVTGTTTSVSTARASGRGYFLAAIGLSVLGLAACWLQFGLRQLFVPWYLPVLTTLGVVLLLVALGRRRTVTRMIALVLIAGFTGLQWYFLVSLAKLPDYAGPARAGTPVPTFQTTLANGRPFTNQDLQDGTSTVMTFFRGRW